MHTPGPWTVEEGTHIIPANGGGSVAAAYGDDLEQAYANAALIAAAPELLAACKQVIAALSQPATYPADLALIRATCAAAIATATH